MARWWLDVGVGVVAEMGVEDRPRAALESRSAFRAFTQR